VRKALVKERAEWLSMIASDNADLPNIYKQFFELNQEDLISGGPQGAALGKARFTAYLLREIYEGNVKNAQNKIEVETRADGSPPFVALGVRELVGFDKFDRGSFPPGAGVSWLPLMMAVKLYRHPRNIIMVRPDKTVAYNHEVIDELTRQLRPAPG